MTEICMYEMWPSVVRGAEAAFTSPADITHPFLADNLQGTIIEDSGRSHLHH